MQISIVNGFALINGTSVPVVSRRGSCSSGTPNALASIDFRISSSNALAADCVAAHRPCTHKPCPWSWRPIGVRWMDGWMQWIKIKRKRNVNYLDTVSNRPSSECSARCMWHRRSTVTGCCSYAYALNPVPLVRDIGNPSIGPMRSSLHSLLVAVRGMSIIGSENIHIIHKQMRWWERGREQWR